MKFLINFEKQVMFLQHMYLHVSDGHVRLCVYDTFDVEIT